MEILYSTEAGFGSGDDLLNFTLEGEDEEPKTVFTGSSVSTSSLESPNPTTTLSQQTRSGSSPESVEEELEWLSNKDAFPAVETCFGILSDNPELLLNHQSPVSVLENSSSSSSNNSNTDNNGNGCTLASYCDSPKVPANFPARARSKRPRRKRSGFGEFPIQQCMLLLSNQVKITNRQGPLLPPLASSGAGMGRRCLHCQADKTPQWRAGPMGPKTLCNACGVRYKSGRLVPEYRPANSPTFSSALHSNSHRKVVEMRRKKQLGIAGYEASGCRIG